MRLTAAELKTRANWHQVLNVDVESPSWLIYLNECLERFTQMALWDRVVQRYQICVNKGCITWPREVMTLEVIDICNRPFPIRNQWFEFLENGPGRAHIKECHPYNVYDRGRGYVMFDDLTVASRIRLYPSFAGDVGKKVTIRGNDSNGQWVINADGTVGETITLAAPFVDSLTIWSRQTFREVIKEKTLGNVRAFGWDSSLPIPPASPGPNDTPLTPLAIWEPTETVPDYRRSFIPYLGGCSSGCGCNDSRTDSCDKTTVTVMARLQFIPVSTDQDFLPISNVSALKLGMLSVVLQERLDWSGANQAMFGNYDPYLKKFVGGAVPLLEQELDAFQGAGTVAPVRLESGGIDRAEIYNMI